MLIRPFVGLFLVLSFFSGAFAQENSSLYKKRPIYFNAQQVGSKNFVSIKHDEWSACHRKQSSSRFEAYTDTLSAFVGNTSLINDLSQMETDNLMKGKAEQAPWSGDYWSYARGILGVRFRDPNFILLPDWQSRYQYIQKNPADSFLQLDGQKAVPLLSPAEKYDLIAGDPSMALTQMMWAEGKKYFDQTGEVEGWMGICHGWAPAAIMEPRPQHSIEISSFDQRWTVELRPAEIKGLVSYSWANNGYNSIFLGQRCNKKDPKRDRNGRLIDPECFDLNPATWHLAVVNRLGKKGQSFVMDATYDYEVWNQPLLSYSYSYYNIETNAPEEDLNKATVLLSDVKRDKYAKYRSPQVKYVVGIVMEVTYVAETLASDSKKDLPDFDAHVSVKYIYDLELNAERKIIGGEWHQTIHPDFIWVPRTGAQPRAPLDSQLSLNDWVDEGHIPESWSDRARASSNQGHILNTLTKALLLRAANQRD